MTACQQIALLKPWPSFRLFRPETDWHASSIMSMKHQCLFRFAPSGHVCYILQQLQIITRSNPTSKVPSFKVVAGKRVTTCLQAKLLQAKLPPAAADPNTQRFLASVKAHNQKTPPTPPVLPSLPVLLPSSPAFYSAHASVLLLSSLPVSPPSSPAFYSARFCSVATFASCATCLAHLEPCLLQYACFSSLCPCCRK